jgi:hypothetical protein
MMKLKDVSPKIRKSAAKHMWDFLWDSAYRSVWKSMESDLLYSVGWFVRTPVQNSAQFKNEISERIKNEIG